MIRSVDRAHLHTRHAVHTVHTHAHPPPPPAQVSTATSPLPIPSCLLYLQLRTKRCAGIGGTAAATSSRGTRPHTAATDQRDEEGLRHHIGVSSPPFEADHHAHVHVSMALPWHIHPRCNEPRQRAPGGIALPLLGPRPGCDITRQSGQIRVSSLCEPCHLFYILYHD